MPYIPACDREPFEVVLEQLPVTETVGELNYVLTRVVHRHLQNHGRRYAQINDVMGALECAKLELYRRIVAPYEDTKVVENGDVRP